MFNQTFSSIRLGEKEIRAKFDCFAKLWCQGDSQHPRKALSHWLISSPTFLVTRVFFSSSIISFASSAPFTFLLPRRLSRWCSPSLRYNPPSRLSGFHVLASCSPYCCGPCLRLFWCQLFKRTLSWGPTRWLGTQLPSRPWRWWMEVKEEELVGKATNIFCIEILSAQSFLFRVYSTCVAWEALHPEIAPK